MVNTSNEKSTIISVDENDSITVHENLLPLFIEQFNFIEIE